jgi:hypothetical protein
MKGDRVSSITGRRTGTAGTLIALALVAGCYPFEEGKRQSATFVTAESPEQVRERALSWYGLNGYRILRSDLRALRAERERAAEAEADLIYVDMREEREGTEVTVLGFTQTVNPDASRRTRDDISTVTLAQQQCLTEVLRRGLSPRAPC